MTETQERFLRTILTRVPLDSVVELHLFPSLRRGTVETGVAVIATALTAAPLVVVTDDDDDGIAEPDESDDAQPDEAVGELQSEMALDDSPYRDDAAPMVLSPRMRILTASYRHTVKGLERGAWVVDVQVEADAPLEAVEAVLRGVRHRSTEPADPELVSHDTLASLTAHSAVAPAA
jgi:hypothetical protein